MQSLQCGNSSLSIGADSHPPELSTNNTNQYILIDNGLQDQNDVDGPCKSRAGPLIKMTKSLKGVNQSQTLEIKGDRKGTEEKIKDKDNLQSNQKIDSTLDQTNQQKAGDKSGSNFQTVLPHTKTHSNLFSQSSLTYHCFCITIHQVKIQIPPSINLVVSCSYNDKKYESQKKIKVDPASKVGAMADQQIIIPLSPDWNSQMLSIPMKLLAVSDTKSKLIGLITIKIGEGKNGFLSKATFLFDKCIDKNGSITFSSSIKQTNSIFEEQKSDGAQLFNGGNPNICNYSLYMNSSRNVLGQSNSYQGEGFSKDKDMPPKNDSIQNRTKRDRFKQRGAPQSQIDLSSNQKSIKISVMNNEEDDECNLINKDDFDEGKNQDIITARATPIKHNALAKKNLTTNRKQTMNSPSFSSKFKDHCYNPSLAYYAPSQIDRSSIQDYSQTHRQNQDDLAGSKSPIQSDTMETQRRTTSQIFSGQSLGQGPNCQSSTSGKVPFIFFRNTPVKSSVAKGLSNQQKNTQKPPQTPSSFQQICEQIYSLRLGSLHFSESRQSEKKDTPHVELHNIQQQSQLLQTWKRKAKMSEEVIYGLKGEIEGLKREKTFILDTDGKQKNELQKKLDEEREKVLKLMEEKSQLKGQVTQISEQQKKKDLKEREFGKEIQNKNLEKQKQEELDQFKLHKAVKASEFFENKYAEAQKELTQCKIEIESNSQQLSIRQKQIEELENMNRQLKEKAGQEQDNYQGERQDLVKKKKDLQKEIDYLTSEQNFKQLELCEVKERLKKREDELKELKTTFHSQIDKVKDQYQSQLEEMKEQITSMSGELEDLKKKYQELSKEKTLLGEEKQEVTERLERLRERMKDKDKELVEAQSQVADVEEKLMITEQQLVSAKANWANAEHEREQMSYYYHSYLEVQEKVQELEQQLAEAKKEELERGRRCNSNATTKTSNSLRAV